MLIYFVDFGGVVYPHWNQTVTQGFYLQVLGKLRKSSTTKYRNSRNCVARDIQCYNAIANTLTHAPA